MLFCELDSTAKAKRPPSAGFGFKKRSPPPPVSGPIVGDLIVATKIAAVWIVRFSPRDPSHELHSYSWASRAVERVYFLEGLLSWNTYIATYHPPVVDEKRILVGGFVVCHCGHSSCSCGCQR